ncbi:DUF4240 domain-containing protein [Streptomyces sp. NPDC101776]|uniref:DUF4240 domain-containing protein n=1 Tax=Streptomyces sp. NPDC101776 TaxID=3366146 RepID=UPI0037FEFCD7
MNEDVFWQLIDECSPSPPDPDGHQLAAALTTRLAKGPVFNVVGFAEQLAWALYRLDRKEYGDDLLRLLILMSPVVLIWMPCISAGRSAVVMTSSEKSW